MTYRVTVEGNLASEVTIPDCSREPRVGQRCKVTIEGSVVDFGLIRAVERIEEEKGGES